MEFESIIGLEIHAQLLTESKIFCRCSTKFGSPQNTQVCPVCIGIPGVLPVLNKKAIEFAIKMALATHCKIASKSIFARKNYFYPDLPKGYQISQYQEPFCYDGYLEIECNGNIKRIGIARIHLEEDAGKSIHTESWVSTDETLVDINRCGVPLLEIVSNPDLRSSREAYLYLTKIRQLVQYLEICDGNMEEGSLRCDANVSIRPKGSDKFGIKTELKNMNSFRGVVKALEFEVNRQIEIITHGGSVCQETLLWDEKKNIALSMRTKEMAHDYRYFPEPDLVPLKIDSKWIEQIKQIMPELPFRRRDRFVQQYNLPEYDANLLTETKAIADYYEAVTSYSKNPKLASNWIMKEVMRILNEQKLDISNFVINPQYLAELLNLIDENVISGKIAKMVFEQMLSTGQTAQQIVKDKGLVQLSNTSKLTQVVKKIITENPDEVEKYRTGKTKVFAFLVGQVMKATKGKANPQLVSQILKKMLSK